MSAPVNEAARTVGRAVANGRRKQGLTQHQLAARAGVSRSFLAALEAGHARAELGKVLDVLDALQVDLASVTGEQDLAAAG